MSELHNHLAKLAIGSPALEAVQLTKLKQLLTGLYDNNPTTEISSQPLASTRMR